MRYFLHWLSGLALVALSGCAGTGDAIPPDVRLVDMRLAESGLFEQRVELDLRLINRNDFDIPIDGLTFDLEVNGRGFASGVTNLAFTIPRLGDVRVPVTASTTFFDFLQQVLGIGVSGRIDYRLSGIAYVEGLRHHAYPYEKLGTMELLPAQPGGLGFETFRAM